MRARRVLPTWAVIVARTGASAKSRLAAVLLPAERAALARSLLSNMLHACGRSSLLGTVVVTDSECGLRLVQTFGAIPLLDAGEGMNAAIQAGVVEAERQGAKRVLILPGDLPYLQSSDLAVLLEFVPGRGSLALVATDLAERGTNALLLSPPRCIEPSFGQDSAARHLALALAAGVRAERVFVPGVAFDLDEPSDLETLRNNPPRTSSLTACA